MNPMVDIAICLPSGEEIHFDLPHDQIDAFFDSLYLLPAVSLELRGTHLVEVDQATSDMTIEVQAGSYRTETIKPEEPNGR